MGHALDVGLDYDLGYKVRKSHSVDSEADEVVVVGIVGHGRD